VVVAGVEEVAVYKSEDALELEYVRAYEMFDAGRRMPTCIVCYANTLSDPEVFGCSADFHKGMWAAYRKWDEELLSMEEYAGDL
jgi:hypothetical protein